MKTSTIKEGSARVFVPEIQGKPRKSEAFYNPVMKLNRDLSIVAANCLFKGRKVSICEPLAATGIRAIRYALEVVNSEVFASEWKQSAFEVMQKNIGLNGAKNVHAFHRNGKDLLAEREYDIVDIDPFGSPSEFILPALKTCRKFLFVTATDMLALCGVQPRQGTPMQKYLGANALRTEYCKEIGARILLGLISKKAGQLGKGVRALITLSTDHYLRVFLRILDKKTNPVLGYANHCFECGERSLSKNKRKKCKCGSLFKHAGPLWTGKLFDKKFCEGIVNHVKPGKLRDLVNLMIQEADAKPLYYKTRELYKGREIPKLEVILKKHNTVRTHFGIDGIRLK